MNGYRGRGRGIFGGARPGAMLLNMLVRGVAGGGGQYDEIDDLSRRLRLYNSQLEALFKEHQRDRQPKEDAAKDEQNRHATVMNPLAETKARFDVNQQPTEQRLKDNELTRSNLETGGAMAYAVPIPGMKNPDGSQAMRAMTPAEARELEYTQKQQQAAATREADAGRMKDLQTWAPSTEEDRLNKALDVFGASTAGMAAMARPGAASMQQTASAVTQAQQNKTPDDWEAWMRANGMGDKITDLTFNSRSPKALDKQAREAATKHLGFLGDLQNRLAQQDATTGGINLNFGAIGSNGMLPGQPKMSEATQKRVMAIESRKNALNNRLASPALFQDTDKPLYTLQPDEFNSLIQAPAATPPPPEGEMPTVVPAPVSPSGVPTTLRLPEGQNLGQQLNLPQTPQPSPRTRVDPVRIFEAAGRDPARARSIAEMLRGVGVEIPGFGE